MANLPGATGGALDGLAGRGRGSGADGAGDWSARYSRHACLAANRRVVVASRNHPKDFTRTPVGIRHFQPREVEWGRRHFRNFPWPFPSHPQHTGGVCFATLPWRGRAGPGRAGRGEAATRDIRSVVWPAVYFACNSRRQMQTPRSCCPISLLISDRLGPLVAPREGPSERWRSFHGAMTGRVVAASPRAPGRRRHVVEQTCISASIEAQPIRGRGRGARGGVGAVKVGGAARG